MPANVQPAHREGRGRLNSMTDEAREGEAREAEARQRATPACTTKAPQHALAGRVANAPGPAAPAGRPARAAAPNATSSRRLRVHQ